MKSSVTKSFRTKLRQLPLSIQRQTIKTYKLWQQDPYHHSLQFKRVSQQQSIYSVRISLNYRCLGLLDSDHIYWYWIGTHDEYDDLLRRL
jgi:hypothetical protein